MTLRYDEPAMIIRIRRLDSVRRSALAAATSERLWSALNARGDLARASLAALRAPLDLLWLHAQSRAPDRATVHDALSRLEFLMSVEGAELYDENCSSSILYGLTQILTEEAKNTEWAMRQVFEAADARALEDPNAPEFNALGPGALANPHPLVQTELARQTRDLREVEELGPVPPREAIERFRTRAQAEGLTPVG